MADEIDAMIERFENLEKSVAMLCAAYDAKRAAAIPADVQATLDDLAAEFGPKIAGAQASLDVLESNIKALVANSGKTYKGKKVEFRYNKGKKKVNVDMLEGMSALIPEIRNAFSFGDPTCSVYGKDKF